MQGIGSHWDEWFNHEASETDRKTIDSVGESESDQSHFISWLARRWGSEAEWRRHAPPVRYTLTQLARVAPFDKWRAFDAYRDSYGACGISAIVIDEGSAGEANDVRPVESLILPADEDSAAHDVVSEGFHSEAGDLNDARHAAMTLVGGRGLMVLLGLWVAAGRRPYPHWVRISLLLAWVVLAGLIASILIGFDPGNRVELFFALIAGLWLLLVITALAVAITIACTAWLAGREWRNRMQHGQVRLRISGGLAVQGGSAGLPLCLNMLLAAYRSRPRLATAWLWEQFFRRLRHAGANWAATGIVSPRAQVEAVALESKIRACLRHAEITDLVAPWQRDARQSVIDGVASATQRQTPGGVVGRGMVRAFASERRKLRSHRSRHVAQSIMAIGQLGSKAQLSANVLALAVSVVMLAGLPDIVNILAPPSPPNVVKPASPSPYYLWISLDTRRPRAFQVAMESGFWANRRAEVARYSGPDGSVRAEIRLNRLSRQTTVDEQDGTVWVERRRSFLNHDYQSGERVGSYSLTYVTKLGDE